VKSHETEAREFYGNTAAYKVHQENMNQYLKHLHKIEFIITYACTGRCKHCSEGDHTACGERIDPAVAADAVRKIAAAYHIQTVMTFGGEPLLYPDAVCAIMTAARELDIPKRQVITNGYFSKNIDKIREVAQSLAACGVNDLLLSVDAFHQETIPLAVVKQFAAESKACGIPIRLQPAWLVSAEHDNPYNRKTREILNSFADMEISVNGGNVIFPEGNAMKYLAEYFTDELPENPYVEDPCDVRCISFSANGDVLGKNLYRDGILKILRGYAPKRGAK
jgi:organic radical activating enzyme